MNPDILDRFDELVDWCQSQGGEVGPLQLRCYDNGDRGIHAEADIAEGQLLLQVPLDYMITLEQVKGSDIGKVRKRGRESLLVRPTFRFLASGMPAT